MDLLHSPNWHLKSCDVVRANKEEEMIEEEVRLWDKEGRRSVIRVRQRKGWGETGWSRRTARKEGDMYIC